MKKQLLFGLFLLALFLAASVVGYVLVKPAKPKTPVITGPEIETIQKPIAVYTRSGGIVGFCDTFTYYANGNTLYEDTCRKKSQTLTPANDDITQLNDFQQKFSYWNSANDQKADQSATNKGPYPDQLGEIYILHGQGNITLSEDDKQQLQALLRKMSKNPSK